VTQPARSIEWLEIRQQQRTKLRLQMFANQGSCSFNHLSVPNTDLHFSCLLFQRHFFFFFVGKMKLPLIVFQEFLNERLGGSLHFPHDAVEKNLTMVQEENIIGESFRKVSIVGNDDTWQFQVNFEACLRRSCNEHI
jgi:hypothetical protein